MTWDCMTEEELRLWREQAIYVGQNWRVNNTDDPCLDCTLRFSEEMRALGKCNGTPGEAQSFLEPVRPITLGRRESNRLAARRFRERNSGRRRALGGALG